MRAIDMKLINQKGITLLVALLLMGVLLGVSASLLNITLKQYQLSGVSYASEVAFQAANAGMECALYHDWITETFAIPDNGTSAGTPSAIQCMGGSSIAQGGTIQNAEEQWFRFDWDGVCTELSVYRFNPGEQVSVDMGGVLVPMRGSIHGDTDNECPEGARDCTVIQSRGYNVSCGQIDSGARVVEREYTQVY